MQERRGGQSCAGGRLHLVRSGQSRIPRQRARSRGRAGVVVWVNDYAPVTIGPHGTAYVGVLGGLTLFRDGEREA